MTSTISAHVYRIHGASQMPNYSAQFAQMHVPPPPVVTLHRYFIAANKMRIRFDQKLTNPEVLNQFPEADPIKRAFMMHVDDNVFMYYWYSSIYVVIEGFKELKLKDAKIEALLQSPNVEALRLMRNATFHFQKEFISQKMYPFLDSKDSVPWVRSLTAAFSEFFLREVPKA
jgi:hypothetical protein